METNSGSSHNGTTNILALISIICGGLALLLGLVSLFFVFIAMVPGYICASIGALLAVAAIVTGIIGLIQVNQAGSAGRDKGLAIVGIVLGVLGLLMVCLIPLISAMAFSFSGMRMHGPRFNMPGWD